MKTAERILLTSLELFNQQGEANVSCVDIAVELDISPGNLYYHYKGKEIIVLALFDMFKERVNKILLSPLESEDELTIPEFFYFLLMLLESIHLFRFFYHNPADILSKYPNIAKSFRLILKNKEACFRKVLQSYIAQGTLVLSEEQVGQHVGLLSMLLTQAQNYSLLKGEDVDDEHYIFSMLNHILFIFIPWMKIEDDVLMQLQRDIENETL